MGEVDPPVTIKIPATLHERLQRLAGASMIGQAIETLLDAGSVDPIGDILEQIERVFSMIEAPIGQNGACVIVKGSYAANELSRIHGWVCKKLGEKP